MLVTALALPTVIALAASRSKVESIVEQGGIDVIPEAMRTHKRHTGVQEQGCEALRNLAGNNAANKIKMAEQGGINVILEAMRTHKRHAGVQEQGCWALRNLAGNNADNKITIPALLLTCRKRMDRQR